METQISVTGKNEDCEALIDEILVLTFSVMGIRFGVDMDQILKVEDFDPINDGGKNVIWFHEEFPCLNRRVDSRVSRVLYIKDGRGIVIDEIDEIRSLTIDCIQPFPILLEKCREPNAVWGVGLLGDEIILLLDFLK